MTEASNFFLHTDVHVQQDRNSFIELTPNYLFHQVLEYIYSSKI